MSTLAAIDLSAPNGGIVRELAVLALRGPDAARFLQGQLSADTEKLAIGASTLAGFHNPQGRVIALIALLRISADEFFAVLPRELASGVAQRLKKFMFRAKLSIEDASNTHRVLGADGNPASTQALGAMDWGTRKLLLVVAEQASTPTGAAVANWLAADIAEGLPQIYTPTSEAFVAQMLNLDLLGAIAFDKGCYTGQEVVARAHYRGRVKRRMQRWRTLDVNAPALDPGTTVHAEDGRKLTVVSAARMSSGLQELLAVGALGASRDTEKPTAAPNDPIVVAGPLPLPYSLPE